MAISHEVFRQFPWIFLGNQIFHIHNLFAISFLLCFLDHIAINLDIIDYLLILVNCGGLVRWETHFSVNHEVIMINSFFDILNRIINQGSKGYHRNFKNWYWVNHLLMHFYHVLPVSEASHNEDFLTTIVPCYSN